jgi:cytochrome c
VVERIRTGRRVRDLIELADGSVLIWDGIGTLQIVESASHMFSTCNGCHALRWQTHGIGPDLWDVVGRDVARHEGFAYSDAMLAFGGRWSKDRLDAFLRDPQGTVPGTTMDFPGIEDADTRRALIEYLKKLSSSRRTRLPGEG